MMDGRSATDANRAAAVVVYDFDGTLVEGDIGTAFIHHLLRGWRRALALPIAPFGLLLMRFEASRRLGVSLFLRVASLRRSFTDIEGRAVVFAKARMLRRRERELGWLEADLAAGHRVVVATGAFEPLAREVLKRLGLQGRVSLVASRLRPGRLGLGVTRHCTGEAKVAALVEEGFPPPYAKAVSDSCADAPLLRVAGEAILVNAKAASRARLRRIVGPRLIDLDGPDTPR